MFAFDSIAAGRQVRGPQRTQCSGECGSLVILSRLQHRHCVGRSCVTLRPNQATLNSSNSPDGLFARRLCGMEYMRDGMGCVDDGGKAGKMRWSTSSWRIKLRRSFLPPRAGLCHATHPQHADHSESASPIPGPDPSEYEHRPAARYVAIMVVLYMRSSFIVIVYDHFPSRAQ